MTTPLRTRYMREIILKAGGVTPTAYFAGVSAQAVYGWLKSGQVTQAKPALRLAAAAQQRGWTVWGEPITPERLAGLVDPTNPPPEEPQEKGKGAAGRRRRGRLRLVGPEAIEAARAKWEAEPPMAHGYVRRRKPPNNCPLFIKLAA